MEQIVRDSCAIRGIYKDQDSFYADGIFGTFGGLVLGLSKEPWFLDNVKEWYNFDEREDPEDYDVEDIKAQFRK